MYPSGDVHEILYGTYSPLSEDCLSEEFCAYHPDHPAKQTIYDWVSSRKVPVYKDGKKLRFLKSEIDQWLGLGLQKTQAEIEQEAYAISRSKVQDRGSSVFAARNKVILSPTEEN